MLRVLFLAALFFTFTKAQCPFKSGNAAGSGRRLEEPPSEGRLPENGKGNERHSGEAPGVRPPESFLQTTFLHNDRNEKESSFSADVLSVIEVIRLRLGSQLRLSVDNENIDCSKGEHVRCHEYPVREAFHLFIVEDPSHGAAVYSIEPKFNTKRGIIEMSLLDALSRHSLHDLTVYASSAAENELGFIRRLSVEELEKLSSKRAKKRGKSIAWRSPLEVDLLEQSILQYRSIDEPDSWHHLERLHSQIPNDRRIVFVLFWTNGCPVSVHAFHLWANASDVLAERYPNVHFAAVACHTESSLCDQGNHVSSHEDYHTVFAYRDGKPFVKTKNMRDANYYVEWVTIVLSGPALQLHTDEEILNARKGQIAEFEGIRRAVTIGIFSTSDQKDFEVFMEVAKIFLGRYNIVYHISPGAASTVWTVRPFEKKKRIDYEGPFEHELLVHFLTQSSFPSILDITDGFTSDVLLKQPKSVALLIVAEGSHVPDGFADFCARSPPYVCAKILRDRSDSVEDFLEKIPSNNVDDGSNILVIFKSENIHVGKLGEVADAEDVRERISAIEQQKPTRTLASQDVHPLRYIQLAHTNRVFGTQPVTLLAEPQITQQLHFHHDKTMNEDEDAYGGCPVMKHLHQLKDEL